MKFHANIEDNGDFRYAANQEINGENFFLLFDKIAISLGASPKYLFMPEAEVGVIPLPKGRVYAKLDLAYGLEIETEGLSADQNQLIHQCLSEW